MLAICNRTEDENIARSTKVFAPRGITCTQVIAVNGFDPPSSGLLAQLLQDIVALGKLNPGNEETPGL